MASPLGAMPGAQPAQCADQPHPPKKNAKITTNGLSKPSQNGTRSFILAFPAISTFMVEVLKFMMNRNSQKKSKKKNTMNPTVKLVGGLVAIFYFPRKIGNVIIPIDSYFSEGFKPTTNQKNYQSFRSWDLLLRVPLLRSSWAEIRPATRDLFILETPVI